MTCSLARALPVAALWMMGCGPAQPQRTAAAEIGIAGGGASTTRAKSLPTKPPEPRREAEVVLGPAVAKVRPRLPTTSFPGSAGASLLVPGPTSQPELPPTLPSDVTARMLRLRSGLRACYNRSLSYSLEPFSLSVEIRFNPSGEVMSTEVLSVPQGQQELANCVAYYFRSLQIDPSDTGATIIVPINFTVSE
ncbi:MAG: hypothetical protein U0271_26645 [Polyangiaceae bacterium]